MALARTDLLGVAAGEVNTADPYVTASFTPPSGSLLVVAVEVMEESGASDPTGDMTVAGGGWTYTAGVSIGTATSWSMGVKIWTAPVTTGVSMTLTVDTGARVAFHYSVSVVAYTGYDTGSPTGATGTFVDTASPDGAQAITLSGAPAATSEVFAAIGMDKESVGVTADGAWTEIHDVQNASSGGMQTQIRTGSTSTSVDWTDAHTGAGSIFKALGAALEIKAAAGGGASTGEKFPTSGTTTNESPWLDEPWVNPGNVVSNNATYAQVTATTFDLGDQTAVLKAFGFDFSSIPAGATIDGVTARIEARGDSTSVSLDLVQLLDVSRAKVGTNLASTPQALTTSDAVYTFGSSSNLWGNSLTESWVKDADFGVAIGAITSVNNSEVYVDYVTLEIQYTAVTDIAPNRRIVVAPSQAAHRAAGW